MSQSSRSQLTRAVQASPRDGAFLRTFACTLLGLLVTLALLVRLTDPLAAFGTGLVPPIVSADRDYKAALYRARTPLPEVVLLGSSRIKTLRPDCVSALTGRPAFNFGVNAGVAEDFLAIFRFMRSRPGFKVREILLGAEPEAFTGDPSFGRSLGQSRALGPFVSQVQSDPERLWSDLWSQASALAAVRSVWHYGFDSEKLPQEELEADGFQTRPLWDDEIRNGRFPQHSVVMASSHAVRSRYLSGARLSTGRLAQLHELLVEAQAAGVQVRAFVPPIHPVLARDAAGTALPGLTAELVGYLRSAESEGLIHYVETRSLTDFQGDSTLYYDAVHMTPGNADRLLTAVYDGRGRCAVQ
jgi:hypothetical protein